MVEITSEEQNKVKRMKRIEDSLRDLWDNIKHTSIRIIGVPEEGEKKKGCEKIFEEVIVENFPNMEKEMVNHPCGHAKLLQSCLTLCNPMDPGPPGSSVHGILQARILEWLAMPSSRESSGSRDRTCVSYTSCFGKQVLYH